MKPDIPPYWFIEGLQELAKRVRQNTNQKKPITRISLDSEFGLRVGIAPGTSVDIHTCGGQIEVYTERCPRSCGVCYLA